MRFIHKCQSGFSVKVLFLVREQEHNRAMGTWDTSELSCGTIPGASRRRSEAEGLAELQPSGVGGGTAQGCTARGGGAVTPDHGVPTSPSCSHPCVQCSKQAAVRPCASGKSFTEC